MIRDLSEVVFDCAEKMLRWTGFSRRSTVFLGRISQEG
jgi:hypothetical protein